MHSQNIQLKDLHVSPLNMRVEKKVPSLKRMAEIAANILPTVREKGILQDLIVRPNNNGFEIVAGRRRFYSAKVIEAERGEFAPLPCKVLDKDDDAEALEISLIENVAREDVDELSQYETYSRLILLGREPSQIAGAFGITEKLVRQRLAIANLLPRIRDLYRDEQIEADDLQILTLATKSQQRAYLALIDKNDAPRGSYLRDWLFGGDAVSTTHALFDLATYSGNITDDLFGENRYFADSKAFWKMQDEAIAAKRDTYLAAKWYEVVILERGHRFDNWNFVKAKKMQGARVYIAVADSGEVNCHEGYISQGEATKARSKKEKAKKGELITDEDAAPKSAITNKMQNYIELHQHAAVRLTLIEQPSIAMRLLLAHVIASSGNWTVRPDNQRAEGNDIRDSVAISQAQTLFAAEREEVRALLGPVSVDEEGEADQTICGNGHGNAATTGEVYQRLGKLKPDALIRLTAFIMAETLASGSDAVAIIGAEQKIDVRANWTPDQTFFDLVRDRASLNAMLADAASKKEANKLVSAKAKDQRAALATAATANPGWSPAWLRFTPAKR
jgi:ParB family chromosome partitioning protein